MKAISIRQPYAGLIIAGIKNVENRSWVTHYQGDLAIVSTRTCESARYWRQARDRVKALGLPFPEQLCTLDGYILGVVYLRAIILVNDAGEIWTDHPTIDHDHLSWWNTDLVGFILENPRKLAKPIPVKGALGLWNLPKDVEDRVKHDICHMTNSDI